MTTDVFSPFLSKRNSIFHRLRADRGSLFVLPDLELKTDQANLTTGNSNSSRSSSSSSSSSGNNRLTGGRLRRCFPVPGTGAERLFRVFFSSGRLSDPCSHRRKNKMRRDLSAHDREPAT